MRNKDVDFTSLSSLSKVFNLFLVTCSGGCHDKTVTVTWRSHLGSAFHLMILQVIQKDKLLVTGDAGVTHVALRYVN